MNSTLKTAYKTPKGGEVVLDTLELHHSTFNPKTIYRVRGYEDFETTLEGDKSCVQSMVFDLLSSPSKYAKSPASHYRDRQCQPHAPHTNRKDMFLSP